MRCPVFARAKDFSFYCCSMSLEFFVDLSVQGKKFKYRSYKYMQVSHGCLHVTRWLTKQTIFRHSNTKWRSHLKGLVFGGRLEEETQLVDLFAEYASGKTDIRLFCGIEVIFINRN